MPEQWNDVKKVGVAMKQNVGPLQAIEVNILKRKLASFDVRQHEFRERFRSIAPFAFAADHPYFRIDGVCMCIRKGEREREGGRLTDRLILDILD